MASESTPPASSAEHALAEHARFVRRVAGSLVRDEATADDVTQDTLAAAIKRPPQHGSLGNSGSARGWLATVVRNVVRKRARGERRRNTREQRVARAESMPSVQDQAASAELVRAVTDALMQLAPAQRAVVMMRFYEDVPLREIAARLEISVNTVKSRLRLALAHMRNALGDDVGPDWRVAAATTFGMQHWLQPLAPATATITPTAAAAAAAGGLAMSTTSKTAAALATCALLAGGIVFWSTTGGNEHEDPATEQALLSSVGAKTKAPELLGLPSTHQDADSQIGTTTDEPRKAPQPGAVDGSTVEATAPALPTTAPTTLEAQLVVNGVPLTNGTGLIWPNTRWHNADAIPAGRAPVKEVKLDSDGLFRFDELEDGTWALGVRLDDGVQRLFYARRVTGKARNERIIMTLGTSTVFGTVYDGNGDFAIGASVRISRSGVAGTNFISQTVTDATGRYRVGRLLGGGTWVSMALDGDMNTAESKHVNVPPDGEMNVSFGSAVGRHAVKGQVRCADGTVVHGPGRIVLGLKGDAFGMVIVPYDKDGRFEHELNHGEYEMHVWRPGGGRPLTRLDEAPVLNLTHDQLDAVWELPGARVRGMAGAHAQGVVVWLDGLTPALMNEPKNQQTAVIGKDGRFIFYGVRAGEYRMHATREGKTVTTSITIGEGQDELTRDLAVPARTVK